MSIPVCILAGRRGDIHDPLAVAAGVTHKCIVPVAGTPMVLRVLRTVADAMPDSPIVIAVDDLSVLEALPQVRELRDAGRLRLVEAAHNIVDSVVAVAREVPPPFIITTADNVLMTPHALQRMAEFARVSGAEAVFTMARRDDILAVHPTGQRRFYQFRDGDFANCNMYLIGSMNALRAAEAFRGGGQFLKAPKRMIDAFGLFNLLAYRFKWRSIESTARAVGRRFGVKLRPLVFADGRLAIDVDSEVSKRVTEEILAREGEPVPA